MQDHPAHAPTVCLLSNNPLTVAECQGVLYLADYTLRVKRMDSPAENLELPEADVYVLELQDSLETGQEFVARLLARQPHARIIALAGEFNEANAFPLLSMGVKGLVLRSEIKTSLQRALAAIHQNGFWVPRPLLSGFVASVLSSTRRMLFALGSADLSHDQQTLLAALMDSDSDDEICARMNLTHAQLKEQLSELMHRFNVRRRWDLILLAHQASSRVA